MPIAFHGDLDRLSAEVDEMCAIASVRRYQADPATAEEATGHEE